jgi:hypothetical protein
MNLKLMLNPAFFTFIFHSFDYTIVDVSRGKLFESLDFTDDKLEVSIYFKNESKVYLHVSIVCLSCIIQCFPEKFE